MKNKLKEKIELVVKNASIFGSDKIRRDLTNFNIDYIYNMTKYAAKVKDRRDLDKEVVKLEDERDELIVINHNSNSKSLISKIDLKNKQILKLQKDREIIHNWITENDKIKSFNSIDLHIKGNISFILDYDIDFDFSGCNISFKIVDSNYGEKEQIEMEKIYINRTFGTNNDKEIKLQSEKINKLLNKFLDMYIAATGIKEIGNAKQTK